MPAQMISTSSRCSDLVGCDQAFPFGPLLDAAGDLPVAALHAMAEADRAHAAVLVAGPDVHRHRIRIVEEEGVGLAHGADVGADVEQGRNGALTVHDAASANGIADALVDAVLEGNVDIQLKGVEPALAHDRDHVVGVGDGFAAVGCGRDGGGQAVGVDVPLRQLHHHLQIAGVDVHKGEVGVSQPGHGENVVHQLAGEADRTGPDHCDFYRHGMVLRVVERTAHRLARVARRR